MQAYYYVQRGSELDRKSTSAYSGSGQYMHNIGQYIVQYIVFNEANILIVKIGNIQPIFQYIVYLSLGPYCRLRHVELQYIGILQLLIVGRPETTIY